LKKKGLIPAISMRLFCLGLKRIFSTSNYLFSLRVRVHGTTLMAFLFLVTYKLSFVNGSGSVSGVVYLPATISLSDPFVDPTPSSGVDAAR